MTRRRLLDAALALSALALATAAAGAGYLAWRVLWAPARGPDASIAATDIGSDFALTNQHGGTTRLADLRGKAVMLFFGYTHCPDVCPSTLFAMSAARKLLGEDAGRFVGVFVTVDPARDTPERLKEYVAYFDPEFLALTGEEADLARVARAFGAHFEKGEPTADGGYLMGHTTFGYLLGPQGRVLRLLPSSASPEVIAEAARSALADS